MGYKNSKIEKFIYTITFGIYIFIILVMGLQVVAQGINIYHLLLIILIVLFILRNYLNNSNRLFIKNFSQYIIILETLIIYYILYNQYQNNLVETLLMFLAANIVLTYKEFIAVLYTFLGFIIYYIIYLFSKDLSLNLDMLRDFFTKSSGYMLLVITLLIYRRLLIQNRLLKVLTNELKEKTLQVEELAVLKERSRIAGEMHDTVGHTLTTALVENEAAKILFHDDRSESYKKLNLAGEQLRKGLKELRDSVKKIKEGISLIGFIPSLELLKKDTEKHTDVTINLDLDNIKELHNIQEKVLYRVVLESITNAINHGKAKVINISLKKENDIVLLKVRDNGIGAEEFIAGFGLSIMIDRVKGIGGRIEFDSKKEVGFKVEVEIPIGEKN